MDRVISPVTKPTTHAWLNAETLVPEGVRDEVAAIAALLAPIGPTLMDVVYRTKVLADRIAEHQKTIGDDVEARYGAEVRCDTEDAIAILVGAECGFHELGSGLYALGSQLQCAWDGGAVV